MLGQRHNGKPHVIVYASKTLDCAQRNYTTTEKVLFTIVFALDKFRQYLLHSVVVVFTDHVAHKFLFTKPHSKPRLLRWTLLLQEFDLHIKDRAGNANLVTDHLSRLPENTRGVDLSDIICDNFPDSSLCLVEVEEPWYACPYC